MRIQTNTYTSISSGSRNYTTIRAAVHRVAALKGWRASPEGVLIAALPQGVASAQRTQGMEDAEYLVIIRRSRAPPEPKATPPEAVQPPPPPEAKPAPPSPPPAQHQAGVDAAEAEGVLDQVARGDVAAAGGNDVEVA